MKSERSLQPIQHLCLPADDFFPQDLFFRGNGCVEQEMTGGLSGRVLLIRKQGQVSFDTYFNLFPVFKWIKYTKTENLRISVLIRGDAYVSIYGVRKERAEEDELIFSKKIQADAMTSAVILHCEDIRTLPDFLYAVIRAGEQDVLLKDVVISAEAKRDENLKIACCFCTYKREKEICRNIDGLLSGIVHNAESGLYGRLQICVADNGRTLPKNLYQEEDAVRLFQNKNYGGSAGFTRCMIESCFRNTEEPFTHVILMDDDALIIPEVVERTGTLLAMLDDAYRSYMIGGALITKEEPAVQCENGGYFDISRFRGTSYGANLDLTRKEAVIRNELYREEDVNSNGWWFTCIPTALIRRDNLPLPMFLHYDDIEYGIRNGGNFIRLNGICVWHPAQRGFAKLKASMNYYDQRNALILQAAYVPDRKAFQIAGRLFRAGLRNILNYQYEAVHYLALGTRDFCQGITHFTNMDAEAKNAALMQDIRYETCSFSDAEVKNLSLRTASDISEAAMSHHRMRRLLNWLIPAYHGDVCYTNDTSKDRIDLFGVKNLYLIDPKTGEGMCFRKSYRQALAAAAELVRTCLLIFRKHGKVYKEWHERCREPETYEFWRGYLEE